MPYYGSKVLQHPLISVFHRKQQLEGAQGEGVVVQVGIEHVRVAVLAGVGKVLGRQLQIEAFERASHVAVSKKLFLTTPVPVRLRL